MHVCLHSIFLSIMCKDSKFFSNMYSNICFSKVFMPRSPSLYSIDHVLFCATSINEVPIQFTGLWTLGEKEVSVLYKETRESLWQWGRAESCRRIFFFLHSVFLFMIGPGSIFTTMILIKLQFTETFFYISYHNRFFLYGKTYSCKISVNIYKLYLKKYGIA